MKNLTAFLTFQLLLASSLFGQHQDEVIFTMYRYHPKEAIQKLKIDSCQIHEDDGDTMLLIRTMVYDSLGNVLLSKEHDAGYDFVYTYNDKGQLISKRIWDYDVGEGPTDSFTYNKDGSLKKSYSFHLVNDSKGTEYHYKDGNLVMQTSENFEYTYSYKNGRRTGYKMKYKGKVTSQMEYAYDSKNNLVKMYKVDSNGSKSLNFKLSYNQDNLLTSLSVFANGILTQQYVKTYSEKKLIINALSRTGIKNGDIDDCDYTFTEYTYFFRK